MYSGSFSGATAASSTKVAALRAPRTLVIRPWPASRMRQMSRWAAGVGGREGVVAEALAFEVSLERVDLAHDLGLGVARHLDQQDAAGRALDEVGQVLEADAGAAALDHDAVDQLDRRDRMLERRDGAFGGFDQRPEVRRREALQLRQLVQLQLGLGDDGQRALGADDHARDVHRPGVVHEVVEVVAGDAAHDLREAPLDLRRLLHADTPQLAVDVALQRRGRSSFASSAAPSSDSNVVERGVGEDGVEAEDVVDRLAVDDGVRAAGVVADAAADRRAVLRRGVDAVEQAVRRQLAVELGQHDAGLGAHPSLLDVDLEHVVHGAREVDARWRG